MNVFRNYFIYRQYVTDDIKTLTSFIKYDLQNSIETNIYCKKSKETLFWFNGDGLNNCSLIILRKKRPQKVTQHQRISHIWLITKQYVSTLRSALIHS